MLLNLIFAFLASPSLATTLPADAISHEPCERRILGTATRTQEITPIIPCTTCSSIGYSAPPSAQPTPDPIVIAPIASGICAPVTAQYYSGPAANFPRKAEWKPFEELFDCNKDSMRARGNSEQDIANLHAAIAQVAGSHGIDDRVLIAMIMQESHGQVNTANAWDGQDTPGLMQAMGCPNHAGAATVSKEAVLAMVQCGAEHFKSQNGGASSDENTIYTALRGYNSGVNGVNVADLSTSGSGTMSYVSDVANRLRGWVD